MQAFPKENYIQCRSEALVVRVSKTEMNSYKCIVITQKILS